MSEQQEGRRGSRGWGAVVAVLLVLLVLEACVVEGYSLPSASMQPALLRGDHFLVSKIAYDLHVPFTDLRIPLPGDAGPARGDVVLFRSPDDPSVMYVKRVIALPGETVEIRERKLLVDGEPLTDPWGHCPDGRSVTDPTAACGGASPRADRMDPLEVPAGEYFLLGDNRQQSRDSRFFEHPTVPRADVIGRVWRVYWHGGDAPLGERLGARVE